MTTTLCRRHWAGLLAVVFSFMVLLTGSIHPLLSHRTIKLAESHPSTGGTYYSPIGLYEAGACALCTFANTPSLLPIIALQNQEVPGLAWKTQPAPARSSDFLYYVPYARGRAPPV